MIKCALFAILVAGCATTPADNDDDDFSGLAGVDQKADAFSNKMDLLGPVTGTGEDIHYTGSPRYTAVTFDGSEDQAIDAEVSALPGVMIRPYIWVLDEDFAIVAKASAELDDPSQTYSANIRTTLPHDGSYYEVVRTVDEDRAELIIYLSLGGSD